MNQVPGFDLFANDLSHDLLDQIFLDLPFAESSVSFIVDDHEGVVCVKMQILGVFLNLTLIGPDHVVTVVLSCASLCGKATQQEDNCYQMSYWFHFVFD